MITAAFTRSYTGSGIISLESDSVYRTVTRSVAFNCSYTDTAVDVFVRDNDTNMVRRFAIRVFRVTGAFAEIDIVARRGRVSLF